MNPATNQTEPAPSPALFIETITAYQKSAAIKAAVELDVFAPIADGSATAETIASRCHAAPRGIRILCDYLTVLGIITKSGDKYALTRDSAVFLNRTSPAYAGGILEFLLSPDIKGAFDNLTESIRRGGTAQQEGTVAPNHPVWLSFARAMGALMRPAAAALAELIKLDQQRPTKVLDISASHGAWGIAFAKKSSNVQLFALDWAAVLEITRQQARAAGIENQFHPLAGSAFDVPFGTDFDVVLLPNFLHHFNATDCVRLLKKIHAALRSGGSVAIVEFVPNPDRITPPAAASFSLTMLASTPEGDAYTLAEYADMLAKSGFNSPTQHSLPASMNTAVIATKK